MAKKKVFGLVGIDSIAGPSEVLIIANKKANPAWVAADMLSQAEHNPGSAVLFTDSEKLALEVSNGTQTTGSSVGQVERNNRLPVGIQRDCGLLKYGGHIIMRIFSRRNIYRFNAENKAERLPKK